MVNADSILLISQTMKCIEFGTPEDFMSLLMNIPIRSIIFHSAVMATLTL